MCSRTSRGGVHGGIHRSDQCLRISLQVAGSQLCTVTRQESLLMIPTNEPRLTKLSGYIMVMS